MYIRLNTAIDSTANRATVEYVDNAINVSLGKITNALNTNNLNVDNIINTIEAKSSAPDCYIYYDNAKGQM